MPHILDSVVEGTAPRTAYAAALHLPTPVGWESGRVWATWKVSSEFLTPWGAVFGGYLAAIADEFAGLAALSVLEDGETFGTTDLHVSPVRALREGTARIEARVVGRGRAAVHVEVEILREDGTLVARASATQVLARRRED
jgi:uncharacterized protein (TIGR00369 family)